MTASGARGEGGTGGPAHVVLLGDSVFDNRAYVPPGTEVAAQLRASLPRGSGCTLAAVDGAVTGDVPGQLPRAPSQATHLIVSTGGNDALRNEAVLSASAGSVGAALAALGGVRDRFNADYARMLDSVSARGLQVAVCTIYDPRFPDPVRQRLAVAGLALFNDVIVREAFARRLTLIDLRIVCGAPEDLANPIEPSAQGGRKIAAAITRFVTGEAGASAQPRVIVGA